MGNVDVQVETIDVISGVEHNSSSSQYRKETQTVTASGSGSGSGSVAIGNDKSDSSSKGIHHVNSQVNIKILTGDIN